jgi:putative ABC transport system ATP-binding protein
MPFPDTMSEIPQALVQLIEAHKTYALGHRSVEALRGVSLEMPRGGFVVLQGPSGSGKTTLLNLIGGIDRPTSGRVLIEGRDIAALSDDVLSEFRSKKLGFIFQNFNLIPVLTAVENIEYPLLLQRVPRAEALARALAMADAIGLAGMGDQRPSELSGGQCQRVAIGRALVTNPALVIADEPTANLDAATGQAIIDLMHQMRDRTGATFVISTHDPTIAHMAEMRFALHDGTLVNT